MPRVSVIIPNFNRATLVGETIANQLAQALPPAEVIVVDDGSTDGSQTVIREFGGRVRLIEQPNAGPGAARNTGLRAASGEFVQFMDSDDLASGNKLAVQAAALERSGADLAYGPWAKVRLRDGGCEFADHVLQTAPLPARRTLLEWFLSGWSIVFQTCLFRRSALERAGWFRTDLRTWEDGEYLVRLLLAGGKAVFTPDCLTLYRLHEQPKLTSSGTTESGRLRDRLVAYREVQRLLDQHKVSLGRAARRDFQVEVWRLWQEMRARGGFTSTELDGVRALAGAAPEWWLRLRAFARRVAVRWRWQTTGARWIAAYQSRPPGPRERELAADAARLAGAPQPAAALG